MTEVLAFMAANACLALSLAALAFPLVALTVQAGALLANRTLRTVKVLARGWPPEHLDADGDHVAMITDAKETP